MKVSQRWRELLLGIPGYDPFKSAVAGDVFDPRAAQLALDFFAECLNHIEGAFAGKRFKLLPWQQAVVGNLFGWKRADGTRRYRECFLYVGRGNGKTPLAAGLGLYLLFGDGEAGAQVYSVAASADQAALCYRHAAGMVRAEPALSSQAQIFKGTGHRAIVLRDDPAAVYRVIPSDGAVAHGFNPHAVLADELHAWEHFDLLSAIETAFRKKSRRQPMLVWTTTADYDRPSPCNEKYDQACQVRDGARDDSAFLPVIYEAAETDDWTARETWLKANPSLGVTVDETALQRAVEEAKQQPSKQAEFKRLHLNLRTRAHTVWIPMEAWNGCRSPLGREEFAERLKARPCFAGMDLSSKLDISSVVLLFPGEENEPAALLSFFWVPAENVERRSRLDNVNYQGWVDQGLIFTTPGNEIDQQAIRAFIMETHEKRFPIIELAYDPWNIGSLAHDLETAGVSVVEVPQVINQLTFGTKAFEAAVVNRTLSHDGNPVMGWQIGCAEVKQDVNLNVRPVKPKRETGKKIDGVIAAVLAMGRMAVRQDTRSVYEERGLLEFSW